MSGVRVGKVEAIDRKLKRLHAIEAFYHRQVKEAEQDRKKGRITQDELEKVKRRYERKMDKLLVKIRKQTAKRAELAGD